MVLAIGCIEIQFLNSPIAEFLISTIPSFT